jgi:hypothetical protein
MPLYFMSAKFISIYNITLRRHLITLYFILSHLILVAQQGEFVSGIVTDFETGEPLPFANVFFNNSTIGTTTNMNGEFTFKQLQSGNYKLIISYIGYETYEREIQINSQTPLRLTIAMIPLKRLLNEVTVTAKRDKDWEKLLKEFEETFLGSSKNSRYVKILNPGVIDLSKQGGELKATAHEPIIIDNQLLGYTIYYILKEFSVGKEDFYIKGYARFDEIKHATNQQKVAWILNRDIAYKGSLQHFLKSCIDQSLEKEGFRVYYDSIEDNLPIHLARRDLFSEYEKMLVRAEPFLKISFSDSLNATIKINNRLEIHYLNEKTNKRYYPDVTHQVSRIFARDSTLQFLLNGVTTNPASWILWGDMTQQRIGDLLPVDYAYQRPGHPQITGRILDAKTKKGIRNANIFINHTTIGTFTSEQGFYAFTDIPEGYYDLIVIKNGYSPFASRLRVEVGKNYSINLEIEPEGKFKKNPSQITKKFIPNKSLFIESHLKINPHDSCVIYNAEALETIRRSDGNYIYNEDALIIENKRTGYQVFYYIFPFKINSENVVTGYYWFNPLTPKSHLEFQNFENNRLTNFQGSTRHLLSAIVNQTYQSEGFSLYDKSGNSFTPFVTTVPNINGYLKVDFEGIDEVRYILFNNITDAYNKLVSVSYTFNTPINPLLVNGQGIPFNSNLFSLTSSTSNRLPTALPLDYEPPAHQSIWHNISKYQEKVFIQTNKEYYHQGDNLFFKANLQYTDPSLKDSLSRILYVELINFRKEIVYYKKLKIENGVAAGSFSIEKELNPGTYLLRAYTNWMLNFADAYDEKYIQLLAAGTNYKVNNLTIGDDITGIDGGLSVSIHSSKRIYNRREKIDIQVSVKDSLGIPVVADFSCSVTDAEVIAHHANDENYNRSKIKFSGTLRYPSLRYPIERTLLIKGKILNADGKISRMQFIDLKNQIFEEITSDNDGNFELFMSDFFDSLNLTVVAFQGNASFKPEIKWIDRKVPFINDFIQKTTNEIGLDEKLSIANQYTVDDKPILLEEVMVRGRRIETSQQSKFSLIKPEHVIQTDELQNIGGNLLLGLQGKVPGVTIQCQGSDCQIFISRAVGSSIYAKMEPLVIVNDVPLYGESAGSIIRGLDPSLIERIEIQKSINVLFGAYGRNGVIALYTKGAFANNSFTNQSAPKYQRVSVTGFAKPAVFTGPAYDAPLSYSRSIDYRTTLYWNPFLKSNSANGEVSISFFAADIATTYRILIEGFISGNTYFRAMKYVVVK